jgi:hypothetical protein
VSIPSHAKAGPHRITIELKYEALGIQDKVELIFRVANAGGFEKDPEAEALKQKFPGAALATLQEGQPCEALKLERYTGCQDAKIHATHNVADRNADFCNWGGTDTVAAGFYGQELRNLIRWDVSALPKTARIEKAVLKLYMHAAPGGKGWPHGKAVYRVLRAWGAGIGNGSIFDKKLGRARDGECSWLQARHPNDAWAAPGCNGPGVDREAEPLAVSYCLDQPKNEKGAPQPTAQVWVSFDVTAAVQDWVSKPDSNFGLLLAAKGGELKSSEEKQGTGAAYFRSANYADPVFRPRLVVVYRPE